VPCACAVAVTSLGTVNKSDIGLVPATMGTPNMGGPNMGTPNMGTPTMTGSPITFGNDPMFKVNGEVTKVNLKPGVRTPILSWTTVENPAAPTKKEKQQYVKYELLGVTFDAKFWKKGEGMELEDAQWFNQLTLMANNKPLLNVSRGDGGFGAMAIEVAGKKVSYDKDKWVNKFVARLHERDPNPNGHVPVTLKEGKRHVGDKVQQRLEIFAPKFRFSIETMPALKFKDAKDRVAFGHLNLKFDGAKLPVSARGLLAQLAGKRVLTDRAEARFTLKQNKQANIKSKLAQMMLRRDQRRAKNTQHFQIHFARNDAK